MYITILLRLKSYKIINKDSFVIRYALFHYHSLKKKNGENLFTRTKVIGIFVKWFSKHFT